YFLFTNGSAKACSLRAFPGIQFIGTDGKPMPTPDRRAELTAFWNEPEQVFVLSPHGGAVSFAIAGRSSASHGQACPTTKGIKFIKPGGVISDQLYVDDAWPYCNGGHVLV